ncbi:MAG: hypothetical protein ACREGB_01805 [Candidatus Saccharimonadales bacterium]
MDGKKTKWKCRCDCGNIVIRRSDGIRGAKAPSCGHCPRKLPDETGLTMKIGHYRSNARKKGIPFTLSREEAKHLFMSACYYCDASPFHVTQKRGYYARFVGNGIDRKDNALGYILGNCVPCCTDCNYLKCNRNFDEFIEKIRRIYHVAILRNPS